MVWTNPTDVVTALRSKLALCTAWTNAVGTGNETGRVHYPQASAATDTYPFAVIEPGVDRRRRFAEGVRGLPTGDFRIVFHLSPGSGTGEYDIGAAESFAEDIIEQMQDQDFGIPTNEMERSEDAGTPERGEESAGSPETIVAVEGQYGLDQGE